ncbi:MAG: DUF4157 domain-containing protein, partial [Cyclobacteriaceae bacterium]
MYQTTDLPEKKLRFSTNINEIESPNRNGSIIRDNRLKAVIQNKLTDGTKPLSNHNAISNTFEKDDRNDLPGQLKTNIESLSGYSMDDVKVHYNSSKPAQLNAYAYAQGNQIHLGPGQEKYLPHEAWHVVQQKQGRVKATKQYQGKVSINNDTVLEKEADVMGRRAERFKMAPFVSNKLSQTGTGNDICQGKFKFWEKSKSYEITDPENVGPVKPRSKESVE